MTITTAMVKELRELTGVGPLDCKKALESYGGDLQKATEFLREKGLAKAAKKAGRETNAGLVIVKSAGEAACAVELTCETDFVARTDAFKQFAHRAAEQVLAEPGLNNREALLANPFMDGKTAAEIIQGMIGALGENIVMGRVVRYDSGVVASYVHSGELEGTYGPDEGRIGVLVELGVGEGADRSMMDDLAHDLTLHITSAGSRYLRPEDVPAEVIEQERETWLADVGNKPEAIKARILEGRQNSFYQDVCLLQQAFVKDDSLTIAELIEQRSREIGAPVQIMRFVRFEVGN